MSFTLRYTPEAQHGLNRLARSGLKHLAERTLLRIAADPYQGKKLLGKLQGLHAERITRRYRVLYLISTDQDTVTIVDISHRSETYR